MDGGDLTTSWTPQRARAFREAFHDFLKNIKIVSKELVGQQHIKLYTAQTRFLDAVFDGLERDVRSHYFLKARQLGISTVSFLLSIFYVSVFEGIQGAIVFDNDKNKTKFRTLMDLALASLPDSHKIELTQNNRDGLVFENSSTLDFLVAGEKKTASSANLGQSKAYNFLHSTECGSYADMKGVRSLERSLAEKHPYRLYIWESRANGFNVWHDMWEEAKADDLTKSATFIGWWAKEDYAYAEGSPLYNKYAEAPVTESEQKKIDEVLRLYNFRVTMEQLAWYRHKNDPNRDKQDGDVTTEDGYIEENLPWTENEAFVLSGSQFFPSETISALAVEAKRHPFKGYRYVFPKPDGMVGREFIEFCQKGIKTVTKYEDATLKVWEDPNPHGIYVIGADPAYASSNEADRYALQVLRVYADGCDQVLEYCERSIQIHHFAWILAHICGAYSNARFLLEINGPGEAVWIAFRELKSILQAGYMAEEVYAAGLKNMFNNIRTYVWSRPDSVAGGSNSYHWKTNTERKFQVFTDLKSAMVTRELVINSNECLEEMQHIVQDGITVAAEGHRKDDRPMALALALRAWHDSERRRLISQNYTREKAARHTMTDEQIMQAWSSDILNRHTAKRQNERRVASLARTSDPRWKW